MFRNVVLSPVLRKRTAGVVTVIAVVLFGEGGCAGGESDTAYPTGGGPFHTDAEADSLTHESAVGPEGGASVCTPKTCATLAANCGSAPDGCGAKLECGLCPEGETCGGNGKNVCGSASCAPLTCTEAGASCGYVSDGCGTALDCGLCAAPQTCGGGGVDNQCGCRKKSCAELEATCGTVVDGCGEAIDCGSCPQGTYCGGAGANRCGSDTCLQKTCAQLGASCGLASDACKGVVECGTCPDTQVCGAQGNANQCGCLPKTCGQLGANCGLVPSGCGFDLNCGTCPTGMTCGAASPNRCSGAGGQGGAGGTSGAAGTAGSTAAGGDAGTGGIAGTGGTSGSSGTSGNGGSSGTGGTVGTGGTSTPTCTDSLQNGEETDTDCGGSTCPTCAHGQSCTGDSDCTSKSCRNKVCVTCNLSTNWLVPGYAKSDIISGNSGSAAVWKPYKTAPNVLAAITGSQDGNVAISDVAATGDSQGLRTSGYGFNIPLTATITGIQVRLRRSTSGTVTNHDLIVQLLKDGQGVGQNKANTGAVWPTNPNYETQEYPTSTNDLWGTTWTPQDINDNSALGFGFQVATKNHYSYSASTAYVDLVGIRVHYCN